MSLDSPDLLLDTHVVLWSLYEPTRLSTLALAKITTPGANLSMSEASLWELLDKAAKGRLPLAGTEIPVIADRIRTLGVEYVPITRADIESSIKLPQHHGDPFDRMLVAQARRLGLTIISRDDAISRYDVPVLW